MLSTWARSETQSALMETLRRFLFLWTFDFFRFIATAGEASHHDGFRNPKMTFMVSVSARICHGMCGRDV